jgi:hypothetical protein
MCEIFSISSEVDRMVFDINFLISLIQIKPPIDDVFYIKKII